MWQTTHSDACIVGIGYFAVTAAASETRAANSSTSTPRKCW